MNGPRTDYRNLVLQATDIVALIGQSVALKRRGKDYLGLCPFHQEKTPSFHVNPTRQSFYCFGCKAAGSAFDFVMRRDRVEFIDALRTLADAAGIEMSRQSGAAKEKAGERQLLLEAHSAAGAFFDKLLSHPADGAAARAYLAERGINAESTKRFGIGFAPNAWDGLLKALGRKYAPSLLSLGGLVKPRQSGDGFYDTFRNRLMFPIRDENGRVIAFGGRVMPGSDDPAKYLNSPETPLFSKSRSVFGLDLARQKIVETRTVAVVEGYTDVVMAHQYGVTNVVSILGTAMTEPHVAMLRRFADRIVLLFDADAAGDTAVNRAVELFLTQPVEIAIASMPEGVDPDEFLLAHGAEAFETVLADAADALTFKWKLLDRQFHATSDLTGRQKAIEEYLSTLSAARGSGPVDSLRWGAALARVSRLADIPVEELNRRFKTKPPVRSGNRSTFNSATQVARAGEPNNTVPPAPMTSPVRPADRTARDRAERWILGILLVEPRRWHDVQQHVGVADFTDPTRRRLAELYWGHQRDEGEPVFNEFLGSLSDPALTELAVELVDEVEALSEARPSDDDETPILDRTLADALAHLLELGRRREEQKLVAELRRTSDAPLTEQDEVSLLRKLQDTARTPDLRRVGF